VLSRSECLPSLERSVVRVIWLAFESPGGGALHIVQQARMENLFLQPPVVGRLGIVHRHWHARRVVGSDGQGACAKTYPAESFQCCPHGLCFHSLFEISRIVPLRTAGPFAATPALRWRFTRLTRAVVSNQIEQCSTN